MITKENRDDLRLNGIEENSVSEKIYEQLREQGKSHKDATHETVNGVLNLKSESFDEGTLEKLKNAVLKVPGIWV